MRLRSLMLLSGLSLLTLPIMADATYIYTGNTFLRADSPYTTNDSVTGSLTLPTPLAPNSGFDYPLNWSSPALPFTSFSFSDGVGTYSSTNPNAEVGRIDVFTNASGNIFFWTISVGDNIAGIQLLNNNELSEDYVNGADGAIAYSTGAGTFKLAASSSVPEPSTFALLGTGIFGLIGTARRLTRQ